MTRVLVVSYSRSGNTARVAKRIAAALHADLEELKDVRPRSGLRGWIRSAIEASRRRLPDIRPPEKDPADYDLVVLGTPVWASSMASPMLRYLTDHRSGFARIAAFVTEGGRGGTKAMKQMAQICRKHPAATLELTASELGTEVEAGATELFVARVAAAANPQPRGAGEVSVARREPKLVTAR